MAFPILNAISFLRFSLSPSEYEETKQALTIVESSLKSDKERIARKLDESVKDSNILAKQLEQYQRDHGELMLAHLETQRQLTESNTECESLRARLAAADEERSKLKELSNEVKMLKKQNQHLSDENSSLEEESKGWKMQCEGLKGRIMEVCKKIKEMEKDRDENCMVRKENDKLKREISCLEAVANHRFGLLQRRLSDLEQHVAILDDSDHHSAGSQLIDATEEQDGFGCEEKWEGVAEAQSDHEITRTEKKTASSMPSRSATPAAAAQSFEFETPAAAKEKSASTPSSPCVPKRPSASQFVVDICSSDDDGEPPIRKGLKRKILSSAVL